MLKKCKPVSRVLYRNYCYDPYHLSGPDVTVRINRSTHHTYPIGQSKSIPFPEGCCVTYLTFQLVRFTVRSSLLIEPVGSYPAFSLSP